MGAVTGLYQQRLASGELQRDAQQERTANALDQLVARLEKADSRWSFAFWRSSPRRVTGLYLWGGVGRGKSMLMDMFFAVAPVEKKQRVHFHEFMNGVHEAIAQWRALSPAQRKRSPFRVRGAGDDPIAPVAAQIAEGARLLCFDEFQVTQIADAMILSRLFTHLFDRGLTVVATSNRHPDALYHNGINRELFLPFVGLLKTHCKVLELVTDKDYRLEHLIADDTWHSPLGDTAQAAMDRAWQRLTLGAQPQSCVLTIKGRKLVIPQEAAGVARMRFDDLCAKPLGAADYLRIASSFHTLLLDDIPVLGPEKRNEAARFVTLVDALYEARAKLVASAQAEPDAIYPTGDGAFEFQRTASRLHEMRSRQYLGAEHETVDPEA